MQLRGDEGDRARLLPFFLRLEVKLFPELLPGVRPVQRFIPADEPPDLAAALLDGVSRVLIYPPFDELRHPAIRIRVAGGPDKRGHAAGGAVTGQHVEERLFGEVGQLVKSDLTDLGALPFVDIFIPLDMGEGHLRDDVSVLVPEPPLTSRNLRVSPSDATVDLHGLVPKAALGKNLIEIAAEDGASEAGHILVPQR